MIIRIHSIGSQLSNYTRTLLPALLLFLLLSLPALGQQLYINEIMASNAHSLADASGAFEDWFEIYNPNPTPVDIANYYVTDDLSTPTKYKLPTGVSVPANGYLILWASEVLTRGAAHVNFKLSAGGESVGLYRPDGTTVVDQVTFGAQRTDVSWGRQPNGSASWLFFAGTNISPGASNAGKTGYPTLLAPPGFSQTGGFYTSTISLSLTSPDPSAKVYYTLDGSDPDPANLGGTTFQYKNSYSEQPGPPGPLLTSSFKSFTFSAPIAINDRSSAPNSVSLKSSTVFAPGYFPTSPIFKGTVVRAITYKANALASDIVTQTYFVSPTAPTRYAIPVVSIATNEKSLFDYNTGIYTPGVTFDNWRANNPTSVAGYCSTGNYFYQGEAWERPANVEFFLNNSAVVNQYAGLRTNGGCSRTFPRKGLRLYGDSDFDYPFFSNRPSNLSYNRLLLRSGGNDWDYSLIIDSYMQTMVRHLKFSTQSNRASVVFINGEYWGVHSLDERYDKYYINRNFGVAADSIDMVNVEGVYEAEEGDLTYYNALSSYFSNTNPVSYSYVNTQMDVDNFTDYQISEIYAGNTDWPYNNNEFWRKRTSQYIPNAPYGHDGRFRWMMKDMDYGLSGVNNYTYNSLDYATQNSIQGSGDYNRFLRRLLDVPEYKAYFINRYADLLNTTFKSTRAVDLLASMQQEYQPYMTEHFNRWRTSSTLNTWLTNVNNIKTFVQQRPDYARDHIRGKFGLTSNRNLTVNVSNTTQGYVKVNSITILPTTVGVAATPYPWTGVYFQGNAIRIVAKSNPGFKFIGWQEAGATISTDTAYSYNPAADRSLTALFAPDIAGIRPLAFSMTACEYRFDSWSPTATTATYPANMQFVSMNQADPTLAATFTPADTVKGAYNLTSSTRINGLDEQGLSFINTGGTNPGYVASSLGGALLALNTSGATKLNVQWTGGTITPNPRQYNIRLRYRVGNTGPFTDLLDAAGQPVEYVRNATAGHSQVIGPVALPALLLNKPYVQLLWQYYYTGVGTSGARDQLRLDDILITRADPVSLSASSPLSCSVSSVKLTATAGLSSYTFSAGASQQGGSAGNTANVTTAGLYSVTALSSSGCSSVASVSVAQGTDLTALMYARPSILYGTANFTVVVDVVELNAVAANGLITVKITKDAKSALTFPTSATSVGGHSVQNSAWTFTGSDPNYYVLTTTQGVGAGNRLSLGMNGLLTSGFTTGLFNLSAIIIGGNVCEMRLTNNADADKVQYFQR